MWPIKYFFGFWFFLGFLASPWLSAQSSESTFSTEEVIQSLITSNQELGEARSLIVEQQKQLNDKEQSSTEQEETLRQSVRDLIETKSDLSKVQEDNIALQKDSAQLQDLASQQSEKLTMLSEEITKLLNTLKGKDLELLITRIGVIVLAVAVPVTYFLK